VKQSFNLADGYRYSPNFVNRRLLAAVAVLALLLAGQLWQTINLNRINGQLRGSLALRESVKGTKEKKPVAISKERLDRQASRITFANSIIQKDAFKWSDLLERLEQTLSDGVALERVQPDPKTGDISLVGQARSLDTLRGYLHGLSRSQWFADAYLLEQERVEGKKPGERPLLRFKIKVRKGF
jgi:type IV pilus assembly protein PilN